MINELILITIADYEYFWPSFTFYFAGMMMAGVAKKTLIFLFAGLFFVSCKKENPNYTTRFTILNAVPNSNRFTVAVGDDKLDSTIIFGELQPYLTAPAATTTLSWKNNASADWDSSFLTDLRNGTDYTLLFYDSLQRYKPYLVKDDWQPSSSATKGWLRFFPMTIGTKTLTLTNDTGKVIMGSQSFAKFASANTAAFTEVDTFHTTLLLFSDTILISKLPNAAILPGKSYSLYATGVVNATGDKEPKMILQEHH